MGQGARRAESKVLSGRSSQLVEPSTAATFTDPAVGVYANTTGNLIGTLVDDTAPSTYHVVQGAFYPYAFASIDATSAVQIRAIFN